MSIRSFYEILGVPPQAQKQEIRNAYRTLALRFHPDKNQGDPSAKESFQEIQAAYETLSEDDKRAKYNTTAGILKSNSSTRAWREPYYGPCRAYTEDPPFWSVELRAMTIQKCARITKIQHLEREIRELVISLNDLVAAETRAASKETKIPIWFSFIKSRSAKAKEQRHRDFVTKHSCINIRLNEIKNELRTAHEDHKKRLEEDNERKTWWARERVRRVEEENRRAATTAADSARRRAERARKNENRDPKAARAAEESRQQAQEGMSAAQETKAEDERKKRTERARDDPEAVRKREREAEEWLARQREEMLEKERGLNEDF